MDEKLEIDEGNPLYGKYTSTRHYFTDKESKGIEIILSKYPPGRVKEFMGYLSFFIHQNLSSLKPKTQDLKAYAKPIMNNFRKSAEYAEQLETGFLSRAHLIPFYQYKGIIFKGEERVVAQGSLSDDPKDHPYYEVKTTEAWRLAREVKENLNKLVELMEGHLKDLTAAQGRPKADSRNFCFLTAGSFYSIFEEVPTNLKDGPFYRVVCRSREIAGLTSEAPDRMVADAIKKLKKQISQD